MQTTDYYSVSSTLSKSIDQTMNLPTYFDNTARRDTLNALYRCDNNEWCYSPGGNTTKCCTSEPLFNLNSGSLAQVENGTAFVKGYTFAPLASVIPTSSESYSGASIQIAASLSWIQYYFSRQYIADE